MIVLFFSSEHCKQKKGNENELFSVVALWGGGGPEGAERRDFQHGQCRGGGARRDPNVDPGR